GRVIGFTALLCLVAASLFGVVPALRGASLPVARAVIGRAVNHRSSGDGTRLRGGLVVSQIAITLTLMSAAALFVRSMQAFRREPLGFDKSRVLLVWTLPGYGEANTRAALREIDAIQHRIASLSGVVSVSGSVTGAFSGAPGSSPRMRREDQTNEDALLAD